MRLASLALAFIAGCKPPIADNERHARVALRAIADAEFDFRANDRDLNKLHDFWTGDVAGLVEYGLIPPEIAMADGARPRPEPYHGYFFVAMELDEDGEPYRAIEGARNTSRFGFCAYPAEPGWSGLRVFVVDSSGQVEEARGATAPPRRYPR